MFAQNTPISLNLPTVAPAFNWDFANGTFLNPRIAFSRNSAVASHFNELGLLKADAANVPRFNCNQNISKGLLIEPAATNLVLQSEDFSNAAWTKTRSSVTANSIIAPNGFLTADKLIEDTTASTTHYVISAVSFAVDNEAEYAASVYLKAGERTKAEVLVVFGSTIYAQGFDLSDGTVYQVSIGGTAVATNSTIESVGNGWYKCSLKQTTNGTTGSFRVILNNGSKVVYTGDGTSGVYAFGAQMTKTNSSYIPTTSAAVTRALDLATVTSAAFDYWRADEYSFLVSFTGNSIGDCCINDFHDGTANERIYLESNSGALTLKVVDGGVEQCSLSLGTVVTGTEYRVAVAIKLNDIAASINGAACVTDTSATLPTITAHNLGSNYAGANQMNGTLSLIRGYAARLPNSQLETLTL